MVLNRFSGWLDYPEYYFFWNFHGNNSIFNISAYKNPAMDKLIDLARFTEDQAEYEKAVKEFVALCMRDVPIVPLNQPIHDVAMQKAIGGYSSGSTASRTSGSSRRAEVPAGPAGRTASSGPSRAGRRSDTGHERPEGRIGNAATGGPGQIGVLRRNRARRQRCPRRSGRWPCRG